MPAFYDGQDTIDSTYGGRKFWYTGKIILGDFSLRTQLLSIPKSLFSSWTPQSFNYPTLNSGLTGPQAGSFDGKLVYAEGYVWVLGIGYGTLTRVNPKTLSCTTVSLANQSNPSSIAYSSGFLFIYLQATATLVKMRASDMQVVGQQQMFINGESYTYGTDYAPGIVSIMNANYGYIYLSCRSSPYLHVINQDTLAYTFTEVGTNVSGIATMSNYIWISWSTNPYIARMNPLTLVIDTLARSQITDREGEALHTYMVNAGKRNLICNGATLIDNAYRYNVYGVLYNNLVGGKWQIRFPKYIAAEFEAGLAFGDGIAWATSSYGGSSSYIQADRVLPDTSAGWSHGNKWGK